MDTTPLGSLENHETALPRMLHHGQASALTLSIILFCYEEHASRTKRFVEKPDELLANLKTVIR